MSKLFVPNWMAHYWTAHLIAACACVCVCEKFSFSFSNLSNVIINLQRARKSILAAILTILTIFRKWKTEKYEKKKVSHSIVSHSVWRAILFFFSYLIWRAIQFGEPFNFLSCSIWRAIQSWAIQFGTTNFDTIQPPFSSLLELIR